MHTAPPTPKVKKEVEQASNSIFFFVGKNNFQLFSISNSKLYPEKKTLTTIFDQDTSSFDIVKATQYGAFDRVQEIIETGFDVNERDEV